MSLLSFIENGWSSISGTFTNFFQNPWGSITGLYNSLVQDGNSLFQKVTLSAAETFFLHAGAAFLAALGTIGNWIGSALVGIFSGITSATNGMGVFGPPIAGIIAVGVFTVIYVVIQALIRAL